MDLSESVILPREDYFELARTAYDIHPTPIGERLATTVQTTVFMVGLAGAVTLGAWGVAKAMDWLEENRFQRSIALDKAKKTP